MVLKEVDKAFFGQRISLAVVTPSDEEGGIDILARLCTWPGDFCAPRIFLKATCSAFQPELEVLEKKGSVICWELECASRKDGNHQVALTMKTLHGAGRSGAVRELRA